MHHLVCQTTFGAERNRQWASSRRKRVTVLHSNKKIVEKIVGSRIFFFLGWADGTISQMLAPHLRRTEQQLFGGLMTWAWTGSCGRRAWCPSHTTVVFGWRVCSSAKVQKNQPPLVKYNRALSYHPAFHHLHTRWYNTIRLGLKHDCGKQLWERSKVRQTTPNYRERPSPVRCLLTRCPSR